MLEIVVWLPIQTYDFELVINPQILREIAKKFTYQERVTIEIEIEKFTG